MSAFFAVLKVAVVLLGWSAVNDLVKAFATRGRAALAVIVASAAVACAFVVLDQLGREVFLMRESAQRVVAESECVCGAVPVPPPAPQPCARPWQSTIGAGMRYVP